MKAVILAGGLGARLRPFTEAIPKPLLPIGEKAILEIQIERLRKFGVTEAQPGGPRPCLFQAGDHLCAASDILASQLGCNSSRVDNAAPRWQEGQ
jgi:hypothetical protein